MLRLYDFLDSGNGYKIRLLLCQLNRPFQLHPVDLMKGESRRADFLAMNPKGKIPVLQLDDGSFLSESNAIIFFWPKAADTCRTIRGRGPIFCSGFFSNRTSMNRISPRDVSSSDTLTQPINPSRLWRRNSGW